MHNVILNWQLGTNFGWGLLGLNLFGQWANDAELRPIMGVPINLASLAVVDSLKVVRILQAVRTSNEVLTQLGEPDVSRCIDAIQIDSLGNTLVSRFQRRSKLMVGRAIIENTAIAGASERLARYDLLLTASRWTAGVLEAATGRVPRIIHEGVDVSTFCPGPRSGWLDPDRFYVFSGGKIEFRKAQDLTLLAFRRFAQRHRDAILVTAWHSPWADLSRGFRGRLDAALQTGPGGMLEVTRWIAENGINPAQSLDIGQVPNMLMPAVLREMHVCLQPSRAEACTSLPVKEAMACGVPVIAALNTGMLDLLTDTNCIPLRHQRAVPSSSDFGREGWGESEVDEIDAALERVYQNRAAAAATGMAARQWLIEHGRTWERHAASLKEWVLTEFATGR